MNDEDVSLAIGCERSSEHNECLCETAARCGCYGTDDGHFLIVLEVLAYAWTVCYDGTVHGLKVCSGANAREHEKLGRVECSCSDDGFISCVGGFETAAVGGCVSAVGAVDAFALHVLYTCGAWFTRAGSAVCEEDACCKTVQT